MLLTRRSFEKFLAAAVLSWRLPRAVAQDCADEDCDDDNDDESESEDNGESNDENERENNAEESLDDSDLRDFEFGDFEDFYSQNLYSHATFVLLDPSEYSFNDSIVGSDTTNEKSYLGVNTSFEFDTTTSSGIPSAVDRDESIFARVSLAYQRIYCDMIGDGSRNDAAAARLAQVATEVCESERSARNSDASYTGKWAFSAERGYLHEGDYKCNMAFGEWSEKAGLTPIYRDGNVYADTKFISAHADSLSCWKPTEEPHRGDVVLLDTKNGSMHLGVVTDPERGLAISAGKEVASEYRHFGFDQEGVARPIWDTRHTGSDMQSPAFSDRPAVQFFEYNCPDQRILDSFPFDKRN
jgi:hypothetical protein